MTHLKHILTAYMLKSTLKKYIAEKERTMNTRSSMENVQSQPIVYSYFYNTQFLKIMRLLWYTLCSFILIYLILVVIIFHMKIRVLWACLICLILGMALGFAMNSNKNIRCYVFLALPQVLSKYGRKALIVYCYILILTGPTKNILTNIGHVAHTIACTQNHIQEEFRRLERAIKEPLLEAKHAIERIVKSIEEHVKSALEDVRKIKSIALSIVHAFDTVRKWLEDNLILCRRGLGYPYDRCESAYRQGAKACIDKNGKLYTYFCDVQYFFEQLCFMFKGYNYFCESVHYFEDVYLADIKKRVESIINQMEEFFYVKIHLEDDIAVSWNSSVKPSELVKGILWGLSVNLQASIVWISWFGSITMFIIFILLLRILWYRRKFLTKDRFDNIYITDDFIKIDLENASRHERTVLPLKYLEKQQYIRYSSWMLNGTEIFRFVRSSVVLLFTCIKIGLFLLVDYFLYWLLETIYIADMYDDDKLGLNYSGMEVNVEGEGFQTEIYKIIAEEILRFKYVLSSIEFKSCLVKPSEPDLQLYLHIGIILAFCWIAVIIEPYILRLRNNLMCRMYPRRSRERALWLYNKILRERDVLFKVAQKQLGRIFPLKEDSKALINETMMEYIARKVLPCSTYKCKGVFCGDCWNQFSMKCPLCNIVESDFSEEIDSDDEEAVNAKIEKRMRNNDQSNKENRVGDLNQETHILPDDDIGREGINTQEGYITLGEIEIEYIPAASDETLDTESLVIIMDIDNEEVGKSSVYDNTS